MEDKDKLVTLEDLGVAYSDLKEDLNNKADVIVSDASGSIASVSDAAAGKIKKAVFNINPVQDLHGQEYPFPPGAFNLIPTYEESQSTTINGVTFTVNKDGSVLANGTASEQITFDAPIGTYAWDGIEECWISGCPSNGGNLRYFLRVDGDNGSFSDYDTGQGIILQQKSTGGLPLTGAALCFRIVIRAGVSVDNLLFKPMLNKGTSAIEYHPYSNICPISGHTSVDANRTGKNLFDKNAVAVGKWLSVTTGLEETNASYCVSDYIKIEAGQSVHIASSGTSRRWFYDANKAPKTYLNNSTNQNFIPSEDGFIRVTIATSGTYAVDINSYQIEYGSTASAYEAYNGQSVTYQLGDTVYSGTLTINEDGSGSILSDMAMVDLGTLNWAYRDANTIFFADVSDRKPQDTGVMSNFICSSYKTIDVRGLSSQVDDMAACGRTSSSNILIADSRFTDANAFTSAVTGQTICYELATPVTISLTAQEVLTLVKGENNVWCDTGDTSIEYRADTKLYIDGKFAELQSLIANS